MAKGDKPSRVLRTKVKKAYRDVWYTIALGYPNEYKDSETGELVKSTSWVFTGIPPAWDGNAIEMPYREFKED